MVKIVTELIPTVKFFNLSFPEAVFTVFSQGGLILTFALMLCRKWRRSESHLLGKLWAVGFFIWIQFLLLGNALPLIDPGDLFPSRELTRMTRIIPNWKPQAWEAVTMVGLYGLFTMVLVFVLGGIITASRENQLRGWRRARKLGHARLFPLEDSATSFWFVLVMAVAGAVGWYVFASALVESRWFNHPPLAFSTLLVFTGVMLSAGLGFQALLESKGGRAVGMAAIFVGAVPIMIGTVLGAISDRLVPLASWVSAISPVSMPFYGASTMLDFGELPDQAIRAVPRAFSFWLLVEVIAMLWLVVQLRAARKRMAASTLLPQPQVEPAVI
jgi:hypothetical protein